MRSRMSLRDSQLCGTRLIHSRTAGIHSLPLCKLAHEMEKTGRSISGFRVWRTGGRPDTHARTICAVSTVVSFCLSFRSISGSDKDGVHRTSPGRLQLWRESNLSFKG